MQDNNTACALLQSGNYDAANQVLQRALKSLKNQAVKPQNVTDPKPRGLSKQEPCQSHSQEYHEKELSGGFSERMEGDTLEESSKAIQSVAIAPLCLQSSAHPLSSIVMYSRAFLLSQSDVKWNQYSQLDYEQYWATPVIFYNLALVFHSQGVASGLCVQHLNKSLRFYELAATLLELTSSNTDQFNVLLLRCAIANNTAHVHACIHSTSATGEACENLRRLLERLRLMPEVTEEDYSLFFLNTLLQTYGVFVAAAAA
jgi:tetratricopeptide (TPR) repeat protein